MRVLVVMLSLLQIVAAGCATPRAQREAQHAVSDYFVGDYQAAARRLWPLSDKTDENFVLNNLRLGSAALAAYDLDTAEAAFLRAYEVINAVGVNDGGRTVGAVLVDEKLRVWKGEPFERAMANFYLGLTYYMRRDYNNARAAFENALFKLRDVVDDGDDDTEHQHAVDTNFALGHLMLAKSYQHLGRDDLARDHYQRAVEIKPYLEPAADFDRNADANLLLVIDFGYGPQKVANDDGVLAGFAPLPFDEGPIPPPRVEIDGQPVSLEGAGRPPVDLLSLAQDRKWQSLDTIRAVKSTIGTGLIAGGAGYGLYKSHRRSGMRGEDVAISGGMILAGLLLKATSQADVRHWEMLPRTVFVLPLNVQPGTHDVTVSFPDVRGLRQTWRGLVVPDEGEATYYFRMQRWNAGPFDWPPPTLAGIEPEE